ncbi:signal peptidase I [Bacillus cereus]|uniref:Signal peptidase I n=1 Tax=Bacillus cereus TaxID=1396 RepID=A0AA44TDE7_BACCE|nr:signal peptidase I [Bacillus cereus]PFN02935.1 signal peptidase I [Bacillus cereus]PFR98140.1 signal peptidase I [Bacillus cereus]
MQESTKKEVYSWIKSIAFAVCIVFICREFIFTPVVVKGASMEPTFENKNRIVVSKTSTIERFDTIVFKAPDKDEQYIKRVIGIPGDSVEMKDDVLYINGNPYEEPYVKRNNNIELSRVTSDFTLMELTGNKRVPNGYYFVLGDNRLKSKDSRNFGFISTDSIVGEVKFQFYPLQEIGIPK